MIHRLLVLISVSLLDIAVGQEGVPGSWVLVNTPGFTSESVIGESISAQNMVVVNRSTLYVGTDRRVGDRVFPPRVYAARVTNDAKWTDVTPRGQRGWDENTDIVGLCEYDKNLFVATDSGQVWKYDGLGTWQRISPVQWGRSAITGMEGWGKDGLFVAFGEGVWIWRYVNRSGSWVWEEVMGSQQRGFGRNAEAAYTGRLKLWQGRMYLGIGKKNPGAPGGQDLAAEVWSFDGRDWTNHSIDNRGFGLNGNTDITSLVGYKNDIVVGTHNAAQGAQVWRARVGTNEWQEITPAGFSNEVHAHSLTVFGNGLYVGTRRPEAGAVWMSRTPEERDSWRVVFDGTKDVGDLKIDTINSLLSIHPFVYSSIRKVGGGAEIYRRIPEIRDLRP